MDDSTIGDAVHEGGSALSRGLELVWFLEGGMGRRPLRDTLTIGREPRCELHVSTSSTSREHARILPDGSGWRISDLSSKNGVFVDGRRVDSAPIGLGSVLRAGGVVAVVVPCWDDQSSDFGELASGLFGGPALAAVARQARLAASSDLSVVLEAESGSGKERFAHAIHQWSARSGAFVPINCAALPAHLAEAELFGYVRGAFTGAERNHGGYFRASAHGTLFLDEILELPLPIQAKLLRTVEQREVIPLGATQAISVATRVVAASQVPLRDAVRAGRIRPDLFARLNGVTIRIPPLRERRDDIIPLFWHFGRTVMKGGMPSLTPAALEVLCLHDWPLNVRELEAVVQRLAVLHPEDSTLDAMRLAALIGESPQNRISIPQTPEDGIWTELIEALAAKKGNVVRAAELLGISRQRAYRLIAQHPEFDVSRLRRVARCSH